MITGRRLELATTRDTEFLDVTGRLQAEVEAAGLCNGRLFVQSLHTTLGLLVNENEPLLLGDFEALLEKVAPNGGVYLHDDFARRVEVPDDEPANGHAHCRQFFLSPALTLLVEDGRLLLGRWQSVFAVELDGPRQRALALQLDGDFAAPRARQEVVELELGRQLAVDPAAVQVPMRRLVEAGGKRVRPLLVTLGSRLGPTSDPLRTGTLAAAVELIHAATLVHDDYVDDSDTRRGKPTVAALEGPERAIAVGDYYFAKATRVIAELGDAAVTSTIAEAMEAICRAQMDDVALRGSYPGDHASYLQVVRGKTAALMAAACVAGAQLAGAQPELVDRLRRYGELLGTAFQMADDVVDYSEASGKPAGQDIRQRTLSLPLIYAHEDHEVGPQIRELLRGELGDADVRRVAELVKASGALERVGEEARGLVRAAVRELEGVELNGAGAGFSELAHAAVDRVS
ncbi:MAG TPA: secondary thiamine-phosphate synthase enzyme YjbQ [Candidatus Dormibacteraeota bacterium]